MFSLSVNRYHKDKEVSKKRFYSCGFKAETVSLEQLDRIIKNGYAWSCATYQNSYRSIDNFISAETIGLDIDEYLTLKQAFQHPFVKKYAKLIYTSPSHQKQKGDKPPCDRFRIVFQIPPIDDPVIYNSVIKLIHGEIGHADPAAKDSARYWCGNSKAKSWILNGETLPESLVEKAKENLKIESESEQKDIDLLMSVDQSILEATIEDILLTQNLIEPRRPGTGTYEESRNVCFALASCFSKDLAIAIAEAWSPPIKYDGGLWNPRAIIEADFKNRGKNRKRVGIRYLLNLAEEKGYELPSELKKQGSLKDYRERCQSAWEKSKVFTPNLLIDNDPFINFDRPPSGTILCLKAPLGSGKTKRLIDLLHTIYKEDDCISLGYRNSLLLQTIERHNAPLIEQIDKFEHEGNLIEANALQKQLFTFLQRDGIYHNGLCLKVMSCIESLNHYKPEDFDNCVLILDEVTNVLKSLLFSTTVRKRAEKIELFIEAVRRAKVVLTFDGNYADIYADFLSKIAPNKKVVKVGAKNKGETPKIKLLEGSLREDELKKKDYTLWIYQLFNSDQKVCVASDSQILLQSLDNLLKEQGRSGLRVDSTTISADDVKEFMADPDGWIKKYNPDYILYSPTAESGLSIDIKGYFQSFYGFLFGVLDVDSGLQIIRRLRDISVENHLWVNDFFINNEDTIRSPLPDVVEFYQHKLITRDIAEILDGRLDIQSELLQYIQSGLLSDVNKLATKIIAQRNYEKSNYRKCFYWALEQAGYDITDTVAPDFDEGLKAQKDELKDEKKSVKLQKSVDIFNASDEFIGKSYTVIEWDADYNKQCAIKKAKLIDKLPEINQSSVWSPNFIYQTLYRYPQFVAQLETRFLLLNPDKSAQRSANQYHFNLMQGRRGKLLNPWRIKPINLKVKTLQKIGILDFIQETMNEELTADHEAVLALVNQCRKKSVWEALGRKPSVDVIKYVRWLLNQIGYDLCSQRVKRDGKAVYLYYVVSCPHKDLGGFVTPILEAITRRHDASAKEIDWDETVVQNGHVVQNQVKKQDAKKSPEKTSESLDVHTLESVTDQDQIVITNGSDLSPDEILQNDSQIESKYLADGLDFAVDCLTTATTRADVDDVLTQMWAYSDRSEPKYQKVWEWCINRLSLTDQNRINCLLQSSA